MTTPPSGMAARDVDERGEATDGVNGAVKPLQNGTARPKMMIETDFMVEIMVCSTLHSCVGQSKLKRRSSMIHQLFSRHVEGGTFFSPTRKRQQYGTYLAHNISVDELMMTSTSRKAATIQQTVYSHSCALQVHC